VKNEQRGGVTVTQEQIKKFERFWANFRAQPLQGRNIILRSICPQIYGLSLGAFSSLCIFQTNHHDELRNGPKKKKKISVHLSICGCEYSSTYSAQ
jgi:hypothetical protein